MEGSIMFDRPIILNKHIIEPYILSVNFKEKKTIKFDFEKYESKVNDENPYLLDFSMQILDTMAFPDSKYLLTHLEEITSFNEFFIAIGEEKGNEEIVPLSIESLCFKFNNGNNIREFDKHFKEKIPLDFNGGMHLYGIYDKQLKYFREEEYASYHEALNDFGTYIKEIIENEEEEEFKASIAKFSLTQILKLAGYKIIEKAG